MLLIGQNARHCRVLKEAERLYSYMPTEAIGLDQLANTANVERTWLCSRYGSREQLFRTVVLRWLDFFTDVCSVEVNTGDGVLTYLRRQTLVLKRYFKLPEHLNSMRIMMLDHHRDNWLTEIYGCKTAKIAALVEARVREAGWSTGVTPGIRTGVVATQFAEAAMRITYAHLRLWRIKLDDIEAWREDCISRLAQSAWQHDGVLCKLCDGLIIGLYTALTRSGRSPDRSMTNASHAA